jgi:hypothetical protein
MTNEADNPLLINSPNFVGPNQRCTNPVPFTGPEQRKDWHTPADCFKLLDVQQRLDDGSGRMKRIEDSIESLKDAHARIEIKLDANTRSTEMSSEATAEILEIISTAKGFFKGASAIGAVFKWLAGIATAGLALWFTIKGGSGGHGN